MLEAASPLLCEALAKYGSDVATAEQIPEVKELAGLMILAYNSAPAAKSALLFLFPSVFVLD